MGMWFDPFFTAIDTMAGDGKKTRKRLNRYRDDVAFINEFSRKVNDALDRIDFTGLPDTISKRAVKQSMLWHGSVWFGEFHGQMVALPFVPSEMCNLYGDFPKGFIYSVNGMVCGEVSAYIHGSDDAAFLNAGTDGRRLSPADSIGRGVTVWESENRYPFIYYVIYYAQVIADCLRTLDVCRANLKNPFIITCEESQQGTVKKFLEERAGNYDAIITSGVFDVDKVKLLPLDTSGTNLNDIVECLEWYESKWRELCGIDNNGAIDKRGENLIQAELSINNAYTARVLSKSVDYINLQLGDVNRLFGLNIRAEERKNDDNERMDDGQSGSADLSGGDAGGTENNNN